MNDEYKLSCNYPRYVADVRIALRKAEKADKTEKWLQRRDEQTERRRLGQPERRAVAARNKAARISAEARAVASERAE